MKFLKNDEQKVGLEAKNWYTDRYEAVCIQRNILLIVTLCALVTTVFASVAIAWLMPLKSIEPFVIQIDETTGITQVVDPLRDDEITANEAIKRYMIYKYVMSRETYLVDTERRRDNYNVVRVMTEPDIYNNFRIGLSTNNEDSPTNVYGETKQRIIKVKSISFLNEETAQVRLSAEVVEGGRRVEKKTPYTILMTFEFKKMELTAGERFINPLGFLVESYNISEEILN